MLIEYPDRLKLPFEFNSQRLSAEVQAMALQPYIYYSAIFLKIPRPGTLPSADDPPTEYKYIRSIIDQFRAHTKVTLARILRLEPGAEIKEHCDPMLGLEVEKSVIRLTIPISGQKDVLFFLNNVPVPMQLGECWYMRLSDQHKVLHHGSEERINLTLDMKPNEWMRSIIRDAMPASI